MQAGECRTVATALAHGVRLTLNALPSEPASARERKNRFRPVKFGSDEGNMAQESTRYGAAFLWRMPALHGTFKDYQLWRRGEGSTGGELAASKDGDTLRPCQYCRRPSPRTAAVTPGRHASLPGCTSDTRCLSGDLRIVHIFTKNDLPVAFRNIRCNRAHQNLHTQLCGPLLNEREKKNPCTTFNISPLLFQVERRHVRVFPETRPEIRVRRVPGSRTLSDRHSPSRVEGS